MKSFGLVHQVGFRSQRVRMNYSLRAMMGQRCA
ncbi:hypothetical protein GGD61_007245 [Bradyrhizobium sp. SBR1B]|nr:hypothetical protein [Bradyrhizobium sp. SBR1B]